MFGRVRKIMGDARRCTSSNTWGTNNGNSWGNSNNGGYTPTGGGNGGFRNFGGWDDGYGTPQV